PDFERAFASLVERGYRVLLAHPERSPAMRDNPARLRALVDAGALCSVTAAALLGGFGDASRWFGLELLRDGLVHSVDSDAHHAPPRRPPGGRPPPGPAGGPGGGGGRPPGPPPPGARRRAPPPHCPRTSRPPRSRPVNAGRGHRRPGASTPAAPTREHRVVHR